MSITPYFSEIPSAAAAAILVTSFLHTRRRRIQMLTIQKMTSVIAAWGWTHLNVRNTSETPKCSRGGHGADLLAIFRSGKSERHGESVRQFLLFSLLSPLSLSCIHNIM